MRLLTLLLLWTAALALPLATAPAARAMAAPCPMEDSGMSAAEHAGMDCCDHDAGDREHRLTCKPGMACFAAVAALPAAGIEAAALTYDDIDPALASARALRSRPPDRALRPPITL